MLKEKTQRQLAHEHNKYAQVAAFDHLPGAARVSGAVLDVLADISPATRWRWIASGKLPPPGADGCHSAVEVRVLLAKLGAPSREPGARGRRLKSDAIAA